MKRSTLPFVAAAALLGGCAMHRHDPAHAPSHMGERLYQRPLVTVKAGIISVSPEPLVLRKSDGGDEIVWTLPSGLAFNKDGISVDGLLLGRNGEPLPPKQDAHVGVESKPDPRTRSHFRCEPRGTQQYACTVDKRLSRPGIYKYTIRVLQGGKELPAADPNIFHPD